MLLYSNYQDHRDNLTGQQWERFKNILVVLDPEDEDPVAMKRAAALARLNQAGLHMLDVLEDLPLELRPWQVVR